MGGNVLDPGEKGGRGRGKNVEGRSEEELRGWRRNGKDAEREGEGKKRARW